MAIFSFLGDGFRGRLGDIVGYQREGEMHIRRHVHPTDKNSTGQQEVRALFGSLTHLGRQIKPTLAILNPSIRETHQVSQFVSRQKPMFAAALPRSRRANGSWSRWHPEMLSLCAGVRPAPVISAASVALDAQGIPAITLSVAALQPAEVAYVVVYDDDAAQAATGQIAPGQETNYSIMLVNSANVSSYQHVYVYSVIVATQQQPAGAPIITTTRTGYLAATYTPPAPPNPPINPQQPAVNTPAPQPQV